MFRERVRGMIRRVVILIGLTALIALGVRVWFLRAIPQQAARMVAARRLVEAQQSLKLYLSWFPVDSQARLLLAEAYALDDASPSAIEDALNHLSLIPDSAPAAAEARFREGQLEFLIFHRPATGEKLMRQALQLNPDYLPAHMLLWKLLDVTGRQPDAAPHFWRAWELSPPEEKVYRLRDWYYSEFSPGNAALELDRNWGVLGDKELPSNASEMRRYILFTRDEPESALGFAAAAQLCVRNRELDRAAGFLKQASAKDDALQQPLYFAAAVALALDQGEFEHAGQLMEEWPLPHEGYTYFKFLGTVLHEVKQDMPAAVQAYRSAIQADTGDAEWTTQNQLASCLRRLNDHAAADKVLARAKVAERLMEPTVQRPIREGLMDLGGPQGLQKVIDLYQALGRERETKAWKQVLDALIADRAA